MAAEYTRRALRFDLPPDHARAVIIDAPNFGADPVRGKLACYHNLLLIERAIHERGPSPELLRAHSTEMGWLTIFNNLDRGEPAPRPTEREGGETWPSAS